MKKLISLAMVLAMTLAIGAGCGGDTQTGGDTQLETITVGASPTPHAEILEVVQPILADQGYDLQIVEFTDYVMPNMSLDSGDLDANYFQHGPYLDDFNANNGTDLVSIAQIHYEPVGLYAGKVASIDELTEGATIGVPADTTNEARALLLLESAGLITLDPEAGITATPYDITENPLNLQISEVEAAQLPRSLQDLDMAVINGNYALQAELSAATDALIAETADSLAAETYANILVVKAGNEEEPKLQALAEALQSEAVREFIETTYNGNVQPMF